MVEVTKDFEVIFSEEMNNMISQLSVSIGDAVKDMPPLQKFYVIKIICEEIDNRCIVYDMMGMLNDEQQVKKAAEKT